MQMLIDFLPLLVALAAYKAKGIYAATVMLMITLPLIPLGQKLLGREVSRVHAWSAILVIVFGGATLVFRNPVFIMWKPSVLYAALATVLAGFQKYGDKNLLQRALGSAVSLQPNHWRQLNHAWTAFFVFLAALNIYVAYSFDEATWFNFKVWGLTGLTLAFVIAQTIWMAPRMIETPEDNETREG